MAHIDYPNLSQNLPGQYIVVLPDDPYFTVVEESDAHAAIAMVKREDVVGKPLLEAFPDTSEKYKKTGVSDLVESFRRVMQSGQPDTMAAFRYDLRNPAGELEERHWHVTHYPVFGEDGTLQLICQTTEDITDEFLTGAKLRRAERLLGEALAIGSIGTWVWDIRRDKVVADKNLAYMFGLPEKEVKQGLPITAFIEAIHPDDRKHAFKAVRRVLKTKGPFEEEYRTINRDGSRRWVIARGRIETGEDGQPAFFSGVLVDITERKKIENNMAFLAQASTLLASSLDFATTMKSIAKITVPDIADWCSIDILDEQGHGLRQVALAHKDRTKKKWGRQLRKQYPVQLDEPLGISNVLRTGKPEFYPVVTTEMLRTTTRSDDYLHIMQTLGISSVIIVPLNINGQTAGAITLVLAERRRHYAITDFEMAIELGNRASLAMTNAFLYKNAQEELAARERLEEQLRIANEDLEARVKERTAQLEAANTSLECSNQELQDFAYVASHDLQEPLRKIQTFGNLLANEYTDALGGGNDYLRRMRNAAARMSVLIEDLLAFSRVSTSARDFTTVNLKQVAEEVTGDLETRIAGTHGTVHIGNLPVIQADPTQMRQLLQNLIANALKFHKPGEPPVVQVSATVKKSTLDNRDYCRLRVKDNGVGFDEKYLDRIFAVFQRLHGRETYEGTGIGLAVCRKVVERHDGTITARSKPDAGSTFIVTLPLRHKRKRRLHQGD